MRISKSKFVAGVQCLKRLYWRVHQPELAAEPDASDSAILEQGQEVGLLAHELFPGGVEVSYDAGLDEAIRTTRDLVADTKIPAIFEGTFENGGVLVRVDILHRRRDGRWRLIEVKSATDIKDYYLDDIAIQSRVVSRSGLDVASVCLAHVNRDYVYEGGSVDARKFLKIRNLTRKVEKLQRKLAFRLRAQFTVLGMPTAPDLPPGPHCTDPVTCEFFDQCNLPRPDGHISLLPRIHANAIEKLQEMGIESIRDIPDDYPLNERLRHACTSVQTGQPWYGPELSEELKALKYPLYFMDFETVNPAIPRFKGMRPYQQIPFQWSVHILREPGGKPEHHEFLASDTSDPRREFITSLCAVMGKSGSVVVYYQTFEEQRLTELAAWFPEFAGRVKNIQSRLWDLLPVMRNHIYHPAFAGSYSLKDVLPALIPEMTYTGMQVAEGQDAGIAWESLVRGGLDQVEGEKARRALLDYCGQDTFAMVRLLERLQSSVRLA
jgi:predicted RecB family nuclease